MLSVSLCKTNMRVNQDEDQCRPSIDFDALRSSTLGCNIDCQCIHSILQNSTNVEDACWYNDRPQVTFSCMLIYLDAPQH